MTSPFQISEIQILPIRPQNGLVAFASCVINDQFYFGNLAIHSSPSSQDGYRIVYPVKILANGKVVNCVYPINKVTGDLVQKAIIAKFEEVIENVDQENEKAIARR